MRRSALAVVGGVIALSGCSDEGPALTGVYGEPASVELEVGVAVCGAELSATVEETAEEVRLRVDAEGAGEQECADVVVVTLQDPLGSRRVVDDRTGDQLEVQPPD